MGVLQVPHDKAGDAHYTLISALHKSIRGSDVQAAIYWYMRVFSLGERCVCCPSAKAGACFLLSCADSQVTGWSG